MSAFLYGVALQWKLDMRHKNVLLVYYVVPLVFFGFMGAIFSSINPTAKETLIQSMTVFGVTMGAYLGAPVPLAELYGSDIKKAYRVGGIPLWVAAVNNFLSAFIHLMIMSTVIYFAAPIAYGASIPASPARYFAALAMFIAVCLAVGTLLGLYVRNTSRLTMVSQFLFLPSVMLTGIMFPVDLLPKALDTAGKIFPARWGFELMSGGAFEAGRVLPLVAIFAVAAALSAYKLSQIKVD